MKCVISALSDIIRTPGFLRKNDHKVLGTGHGEDLMEKRDELDMKFLLKKTLEF